MDRSLLVKPFYAGLCVLTMAIVAAGSPVHAIQPNQVDVTGVVVDAESGAPIGGAVIELNDLNVAVTGDDGRFRATLPLDPNTRYVAVATRIGYQRGQREFTVQNSAEAVDLIFSLSPIPVRLEEINVEGEATEAFLANLTGFNRRRDNLPGHFFTRTDIERIGAQRLTEVVRRVPGSIVYSPDNVFLDLSNPGPAANNALEQRTSITFQRSGFSRGAPCEALVFVNDVQVSDPNIDWLVDPQSIVAMEVYNGSSQVPAEYNKRGADCGVVVVWTDAPTRQRPGLVNTLEVGGTVTGRMGGGIDGERFGIQMRLPIAGPIEFHPSFHLIVGNSPQGDAGWQLLTAFKAKPLGQKTPWYVGAGMTIIKNRTSSFDSGRNNRESTDVMPLGVTGLSLPVGPVRPFIEFQLIDPFGNNDGYIAAGMTILQR